MRARLLCRAHAATARAPALLRRTYAAAVRKPPRIAGIHPFIPAFIPPANPLTYKSLQILSRSYPPLPYSF